MGIRRLFNKLGFSGAKLSDDNYELSRRRFIIEGCLSNAIFTFTSGAFIVGYAKYLGASDQFNGIIVALPLLTYILQMFSPLFLERLSSRKKVVLVTCIFYRTLLGLMVLIPFITHDKAARLMMLAVMYFGAYLVFSFSNPAGGSWIISLVPERMRGRYFGMRDMCILGSAAVLSLLMGRILDIFKSNSLELVGFVVVFSVTLILVVFNGIMLSRIKEPEIVQLKQSLNLKNMLTMPLKNKQFRKVVILNIVWNLTVQLSLPFFSVYMVTGLKLSYTFIMAMGIFLSFVQAFSAKIWGKLSEKVGWEFTTVTSIAMIGTVHVIWIFVNKNTCYVLIPFIQILAGMAWAGVNLSFFNIQFKYAPQEGRTIFVGFNAAFAGVAGFLSALIGASLVGLLNGVKINIGLTVLDNMQFIFGVSGVLIICCSLFASRLFTAGKDGQNRINY